MKRFLFLFILFTSCSKGYLYVQQEKVDRDYLASSYVDSPDPKQCCPPCGDRILLSWRFPRCIFSKELFFHLTVLFWDHTSQKIISKVQDRRGTGAFYFPLEKRGKVLSYKLEAKTKEGVVVESWTHRFWVESIIEE